MGVKDEPKPSIITFEPTQGALEGFEDKLELIFDKKRPRFLKKKCTLNDGKHGPQQMILTEVSQL